MKRTIIFTLIALLLLNVYAEAQTIKGKVVDAASGNPIANANIFLQGSSKGTTTNAQGEFVLYTNETKTPLVVSYIGYQPDTIYNYHGKTVTAALNRSAQVLREVIVGDGNITRRQQMKIFVTQFIGAHSKDCIIMNPDDINFTYHKKTGALEASIYKPLIIRNKKLGYKITYFLTAFSYAPAYTSYTEEPYMQTSYSGNSIFEEDTLGLTPAEMKKIHKARDKAYYGSRMHFIRLVLAGVNWKKGSLPGDEEKTKFSYMFGSHEKRETNFIFNNIRANKEQLFNSTILSNDGYWFIDKPWGSMTYKGYENSWVTFQSGEITLRRHPALTPDSYNESNLIWCGKMAEQRVSELLPMDFEPSEP